MTKREQNVKLREHLEAARTERDEHEWCYAEFHRCDGGGPGEFYKFTDNDDGAPLSGVAVDWLALADRHPSCVQQR